MPETTPLIKAALNLRVGVGFDVYAHSHSASLHAHVLLSQNTSNLPKALM